ncbi:MAG: ABC transporter permease subunit [Bacteroidota bacterium]
MIKIVKYVIVDLLRNRIMLFYTALLLVISLSVFNLEDNADKSLVSLLNIILIIVPLISIVFSTIYTYNSSEFIELLVSQPLKRSAIWLSVFLGLAVTLSLAFFLGVGLPILIYQATATGIIMLTMGITLSVIFVAIALLAAVLTRDKAKGIGLSILLWLYFSLIYDGLVLFILFQFSDYPLEKAMVALSFLNPIDLGRILVLIKMDISALMGYTGAVFRLFFDTRQGLLITAAILSCWIIIPILLSINVFRKKDL